MTKWNSGSLLLRQLCPQIENVIALYEPRRRHAIWRSILSAFAENGTDIHQLSGQNQDVDAILATLPRTAAQAHHFDPFTMTGDTTLIGVPERIELIGGPYDGSALQLGIGFHEIPPKRMALQGEPQTTRGAVTDEYVLCRNRDPDLEEFNDLEALSYRYQPAS